MSYNLVMATLLFQDSWLKSQGGDSLTFGTEVLMSSNFLKNPNIQTSFSKSPNNQLSSSEINLDTKKWLGQLHTRNIRPQMISTTPNLKPHMALLGPRNFRPQIISPTPNCRPQISTSAPQLQKSRSSPTGAQISGLSQKLFFLCFCIKW